MGVGADVGRARQQHGIGRVGRVVDAVVVLGRRVGAVALGAELDVVHPTLGLRSGSHHRVVEVGEVDDRDRVDPAGQRPVRRVPVGLRRVEDEVVHPTVTGEQRVHRFPRVRVGDVEDPDASGTRSDHLHGARGGQGHVDGRARGHRITDRGADAVGQCQPGDTGLDRGAREHLVVALHLYETDRTGLLGGVHLLLEGVGGLAPVVQLLAHVVVHDDDLALHVQAGVVGWRAARAGVHEVGGLVGDRGGPAPLGRGVEAGQVLRAVHLHADATALVGAAGDAALLRQGQHHPRLTGRRVGELPDRDVVALLAAGHLGHELRLLGIGDVEHVPAPLVGAHDREVALGQDRLLAGRQGVSVRVDERPGLVVPQRHGVAEELEIRPDVRAPSRIVVTRVEVVHVLQVRQFGLGTGGRVGILAAALESGRIVDHLQLEAGVLLRHGDRPFGVRAAHDPDPDDEVGEDAGGPVTLHDVVATGRGDVDGRSRVARTGCQVGEPPLVVGGHADARTALAREGLADGDPVPVVHDLVPFLDPAVRVGRAGPVPHRHVGTDLVEQVRRDLHDPEVAAQAARPRVVQLDLADADVTGRTRVDPERRRGQPGRPAEAGRDAHAHAQRVGRVPVGVVAVGRREGLTHEAVAGRSQVHPAGVRVTEDEGRGADAREGGVLDGVVEVGDERGAGSDPHRVLRHRRAVGVVQFREGFVGDVVQRLVPRVLRQGGGGLLRARDVLPGRCGRHGGHTEYQQQRRARRDRGAKERGTKERTARHAASLCRGRSREATSTVWRSSALHPPNSCRLSHDLSTGDHRDPGPLPTFVH